MNFLRKINFKVAPLLSLGSRLLEKNTKSVTNQPFSSLSLNAIPSIVQNFLRPNPVLLVPACGLKIKGFMRLRCKDCYYVRREGRLYVMCKSFPRHKQAQMAPRPKATWILSHACQSRLRPY